MELDQYINRWKNRNRVELEISFRIRDYDQGEWFTEAKANELEGEIKSYQEYAYPGVSYTREGNTFHLKMATIDDEGHVDYFDRLRMTIGMRSSSIEILPNQTDSHSDRPQLDK